MLYNKDTKVHAENWKHDEAMKGGSWLVAAGAVGYGLGMLTPVGWPALGVYGAGSLVRLGVAAVVGAVNGKKAAKEAAEFENRPVRR